MTQAIKQIHLTETAVADIEGVRVGLANVWEESFTDSEGHQQHAVRGTICLMFDDSTKDFDVRLSVGDEVSIGHQSFQVVDISEGAKQGSLTLEPIVSKRPKNDEVHSAAGGPPSAWHIHWVDALLPIPFFFLPYIASSSITRAALAAACLIAWFVIMRPRWHGLHGFYVSSLLLLHALTWTIVAVGVSVFG